MKVFLSGTDSPRITRLTTEKGCPYLFFSKQNLSAEPELYLDSLLDITDDQQEVFLDNGCFEIQRKQLKGKRQDFDYETYTEEYIRLLKDRTDKIRYYAAIDPHTNGQKVVEYSLNRMEEEGLEPMPVWHLDWSEDKLVEFAESYEHLAIGKVANLKKHTNMDDDVVSERLERAISICNRHDVKVHLFGVGNPTELWKYRNRVYSVDNTNWTRYRQQWRWVYGHEFKGRFKQVRDFNTDTKELRNHNLKVWNKISNFYRQFGEWDG